MGKLLGRIKADAGLLRQAAKTARKASRHVAAGHAGSREAELTFSGIPEERRKELADTLNALTGNTTPEDYPRTELLTCKAITAPGFSLAVGYGQVLATFYSLLQEAGLKPEEIASSTVTIQMEATDEDAPPAKSNPAGRLAYGLNIAAAEAFDTAARHDNGDLSFLIQGLLIDCEEDSEALLASIKALGIGEGGEVVDGALPFNIITDRVGSGLGGLLLCFHNLASVFEQAPAGASLVLQASPADASVS